MSARLQVCWQCQLFSLWHSERWAMLFVLDYRTPIWSHTQNERPRRGLRNDLILITHFDEEVEVSLRRVVCPKSQNKPVLRASFPSLMTIRLCKSHSSGQKRQKKWWTNARTKQWDTIYCSSSLERIFKSPLFFSIFITLVEVHSSGLFSE